MIRLADLLAANPDARCQGPVFAEQFAGFCFDSRLVQPDQLFLAVRSDRADGHDYIDAACRGGATGVVCQAAADLTSFGATCVLVPDTRAALSRYAAWALARSGIPVVGITGSAGKTSAKEMIAHVLGAGFRVFRNPGNFNDSYGLPIAIGGLEPEHELAVLEMATDRFGEIAELAALARPRVGVVTLVAPAHLHALRDLEGVAREKGALVEALPPEGLAVLNADDPRVAAMAERTPARVLRCGLAEGADLRALDIRLSLEGTDFGLEAEGARLRVHLPWLGAQFVRTALYATAVGRWFGLDFETIAARLAELPPLKGRMNRLPGRHGSLIIDDSYNASPEAVLAGLEVLARLPARRRVAVLGEMAELGELAEASHRAVGERAAGVVDRLVTRGQAAARIAEAARGAGMDPARIAVTFTVEDALAALEPELAPGTLVYAKGSAVARMEQVVAGLMAQPERAAEALVRQNAAWRQIVVLEPDRPTWVEVDLGAIAANTRRLKELAGPAALIAVLKADAYGHGAPQVAHTVLRHGATSCAVACLSEGRALREAGIDAPLLVLGYTPAWQAREAVGLDLTVTLFEPENALAFGRAAQAMDRRLRVQVKVDSGMHRLGLPPEAVPAFLRQLAQIPSLELTGLFTHMACADEDGAEGRGMTDAQLERFERLLAELEAAGLRPPCVHAANSALLLTRPGARFDAVRPGIALYGLAPAAALAGDPQAGPVLAALRPALAWKTQIAQLRDLAPGEPVGYGAAWRAARPSRLATIPVGYADGFRRAPQAWRAVLVRGALAPVVGRVSMDQTTIDVTEIPGARQGDEVLLIGRQGEARIDAETVADWLGTLNYEVVSAILARVPRVSQAE